ncbi:MAG: type I restriction endonuclease [Bacteroidia bacterium]
MVIEFKSAVQEEVTIHEAYVQLTTRYRQDIPELFKCKCFCIISDGVNNKGGRLLFRALRFLLCLAEGGGA